MQIPAIEAAKRLGLEVTVVDGFSGAMGISLAHHFLALDLKDKEGILEAARKDKNIAGIMTAGTDFSATVAFVAEKLGLPGIDYETALNATHKGLMRKVFDQKGIPSPRFLVYRAGEDIGKISETIGFPCVIKPVDNMGARGVKKIYNLTVLKNDIQESLGFSRCGEVIVEEFMEGPEFSVDAIIYQNQIQICGIADRHIYFDPFFIEMGHTMPSSFARDKLNEVENIFIQGIRALGLHTGAAKGDIKLTKKGPMLGEIAARLSGGYMSGWTYPLSSGINPAEAAVKIAVGEDPGKLLPTEKQFSAERAFISVPGMVKGIVHTPKNLIDPRIKEVFFRIKKGDNVLFPRNNVEKCGNIISQADDSEEASLLCRMMINNIHISLEPGNENTEALLYGLGQSDFPPQCLEFSENENNDFISELISGCPHELPEVLELNIMALPKLALEKAIDWYGNTLQEILGIITQKFAIKWEGEGSKPLSLAFWLSIKRGGLQGAFHTLESFATEESRFLKRLGFA